MALVLTLKPGDDVFVNDDKFTLTKIVSDKLIYIKRDKDGQVFNITDSEWFEADPEVMFTLGDRATTKEIRLMIEAPRTKILATGDKYWAAKNKKP